MNSFHIGNLKIPVPLIQGGMGIGIYTPRVNQAVTNTNNVGFLVSESIGATLTVALHSYLEEGVKTRFSPGILLTELTSVISDDRKNIIK
ncbi:MAG: hypothetical protein K9I68_05805 [Bacteroidales bacterium]|nr:hypothetical protein [Bacteroidales bacterium]